MIAARARNDWAAWQKESEFGTSGKHRPAYIGRAAVQFVLVDGQIIRVTALARGRLENRALGIRQLSTAVLFIS
jgi:hypothetical protein